MLNDAARTSLIDLLRDRLTWLQELSERVLNASAQLYKLDLVDSIGTVVDSLVALPTENIRKVLEEIYQLVSGIVPKEENISKVLDYLTKSSESQALP